MLEALEAALTPCHAGMLTGHTLAPHATPPLGRLR
jgi:hypothetical protein